VVRECREELGYKVKVIAELGEVDDYYNLIHRNNHNISFFVSGKAISSERNLFRRVTNSSRKRYGCQLMIFSPSTKRPRRRVFPSSLNGEKRRFGGLLTNL
jgi:hypothetical protein